MTWGAIGAAAIGTVGGAILSKKGGSSGGGGQQSTTQTSEPWSGVQPFLLGNQTTEQRLKQGVAPVYQNNNPLSWEQWSAENKGGEWTDPSWGDPQSWGPSRADYDQYIQDSKRIINPSSDYETVTTGTPGLYQGAYDLLQRTGWSPEMQKIVDEYGSSMKSRIGQLQAQQGQALPSSATQERIVSGLLGGVFDPSIQKINAGNVSTGDVTGMMVDPVAARSSQGLLDPTGALQKLLSGNPDNPYLDKIAGNITGMATRNLQEQVLPGLRSSAVNTGAYGGSRQGIAEALAMSRMNTDLAPALSNLYGTAYENAQGRMQTTASGLNQQATDIAAANANRQLQAAMANASNRLAASQANAGNDIQVQQMNNAQMFQRQNDITQNRLNALGLQQSQEQMQRQQEAALADQQNQYYQQMLNMAKMPGETDWQNYQRYASILSPGAGFGGTSTTTISQPQAQSNMLQSALGGGLLGYDLYNKYSNSGSSGSIPYTAPATVPSVNFSSDSGSRLYDSYLNNQDQGWRF